MAGERVMRLGRDRYYVRDFEMSRYLFTRSVHTLVYKRRKSRRTANVETNTSDYRTLKHAYQAITMSNESAPISPSLPLPPLRTNLDHESLKIRG